MGSNFQTQNGGNNSEERFPLLPSHQSSSMSGGSSTAIRGRVPLINTMESNLDDAGDLVMGNEESMPAASTRHGASLSRRAGSGSGMQWSWQIKVVFRLIEIGSAPFYLTMCENCWTSVTIVYVNMLWCELLNYCCMISVLGILIPLCMWTCFNIIS